MTGARAAVALRWRADCGGARAAGIDWDNVRNLPAPIDPGVKRIDDTSNFDEFPDIQEDTTVETSSYVKDLAFMNYTFKRFEGLTMRGGHLKTGGRAATDRR